MVTKDFLGKTLFLDTAPLIYFIEGHSEYQDKLLNLFISADKGEFSFISSTLTLLEVLVKPIKDGRKDIVEQYTAFLTSARGIDLFDINVGIAKEAAYLRARYNLRTPDSIQIATALVIGADYFITNDNRLTSVTELQVVVLSDLK
ncbi:MAG: type II toxin-antitoxin system VapC family toxin [Dinghuibacter sp.]|nr:type II toxin-antitoxin system VapC family toxin [Dinghuibacter sp.]